MLMKYQIKMFKTTKTIYRKEQNLFENRVLLNVHNTVQVLVKVIDITDNRKFHLDNNKNTDKKYKM